MSRASLADTSLFVAVEQHRPLRESPRSSIAVSMITIGELHLGVLSAPDDIVRALRLRTLTRALSFDPLTVDDSVASSWAELRATLRSVSRKMPPNGDSEHDHNFKELRGYGRTWGGGHHARFKIEYPSTCRCAP